MKSERPAVYTREFEPLMSQLYSAINAAAVAERYARMRGRDLKFTPEDIRALAIASYIQQGRRRV
jgi:hypothetical protein